MPNATPSSTKATSQPEPPPREKRSASVSRIVIALIATWTALVAIPGAVPWAAKDDAARALAIGVGISSIIALVGLALAFVREDSLGDDGARFGTAAALVGVVLTGLEVVNLMLIPDDAKYRQTATGLGLLVLLVVALLAVGGSRAGLFEGLKFSSLSLAGTVAGVALVAVYLLVVQGLFVKADLPKTSDSDWQRMMTLLSGLQSLAFAAAGALLGTTVQAQVTSNVKTDLAKADSAKSVLRSKIVDLKAAAQKGELPGSTHGPRLQALVEQAIADDPQEFHTTSLRKARALHYMSLAGAPQADLVNDLDRTLEQADRIRTG